MQWALYEAEDAWVLSSWALDNSWSFARIRHGETARHINVLNDGFDNMIPLVRQWISTGIVMDLC